MTGLCLHHFSQSSFTGKHYGGRELTTGFLNMGSACDYLLIIGLFATKCWKGRLDKARMVCRLAKTLTLIWASQTMSVSWLNCLNSLYLCWRRWYDGKWDIFARVQGELAEDKGQSFGAPGWMCHQPSQFRANRSRQLTSLCSSALSSTHQHKALRTSYDAVVSLVQRCIV